jgi:hypothetical protein
MTTRRLCLAAILLAPVACAPEPEDLAQQLEGRLNAYAQALHDGDEAALRGLLSDEVLDKARTLRGGLPRFATRQKAAMLRQFKGMKAGDLGEGFRVVKVEPQGEVVAAHIAYQDREIPRPFYFVREGGELKLNVARPGFSRRLGPAFSANDNYNVRNDSFVNAWVSCASDGGRGLNWIDVMHHSTRFVSCRNTCGLFNGSYFNSSTHVFVGSRQCDYNSWGDDVILSDTPDGPRARCEDEC